LKKKDKDKIVDPVGIELAREIPKLMEEYLQSVEKTESLIKSARFRSTDAQEFREKVVAYDQARRNRHNALLSRINMAIRLARGLGIEPIIYRTLDTDTSSIDRDTAVDYSKIVVDLYGNGRF
jgi:hypothetical protein